MAQDYRDDDGSWSRYARTYDPIKVGSIDGTDTVPHDAAVLRALRSHYAPCAPSSLSEGRAHCTLFVAGLNPRTTQECLAEECARAAGGGGDGGGGGGGDATVVSCRIVRDLVTGRSRRYAFVEFARRAGAERAHRALDGECVDGARVLVEWEARRALPGWRPRRLGGGFGGDKRSGQLRFGCRRRPFRRPIVAPAPPPPKARAETRLEQRTDAVERRADERRAVERRADERRAGERRAGERGGGEP